MEMTKSKNPNSIVLASAKIEIAKKGIEIDKVKKTWDFNDLVDLGLARGIKISFSSSKIDIPADNGTVPLKGQTNNKGRVEFSLLERHLPFLGMVMEGLVTVSVNPSEKKTYTDEKGANGFEKDKFYPFKKVNYDGAKPANIAVKQGVKVLALTTDYTVEQNASGEWGYKFSASGTADTGKAVTIEYEVQGIKSYTLGKGSGGVAKQIGMKLTNQRKADDGRIITRTWEFPFGFYDGEDSIQLKSKNDADNAAEVPMAFEFSPHPDLILDEKLEGISLYREGQEV